MRENLLSLTIDELSRRHPAFADFLASTDATGSKPGRTLEAWLAGLTDDRLSQVGMDRDQIRSHLEALVRRVDALRAAPHATIRSLTILGGRDKSGRAETLTLVLKAGEVLCIVGPTGSGKSRLLADIECLAQGDTPSGRRVLIDDAPPAPGWRQSSERKLVAQLSQNMNFVVDLSVGAFVAMHADCRMVPDRGERVRDVIACANDLAGEPFSAQVSLTQLSGGQTRALMIADIALLSASPVVLIDEIENAGIDRKRALDLLIAKEKIVVISTHDPILALMGGRRVVIRNGAITDIIETSAPERANIAALERIDRGLIALRHRLRCGQRIDAPLAWAEELGKV
ncbi:MAG: ATP-binding cassette domain-containing protein [Azospirillaceae bacterium]|nr:ATP-binding cassette domain-containing protein [Azospirillaceae bacterium]